MQRAESATIQKKEFSMEILIYQAVIGSLIVGAAFLKGAIGLKWATGAAIVWTLFHVYAPWLMGIQFITIGIAYAIGNSITADEA